MLRQIKLFPTIAFLAIFAALLCAMPASALADTGSGNYKAAFSAGASGAMKTMASSAGSESEPNDTFQTATPVGFDTMIYGVTDSSSCKHSTGGAGGATYYGCDFYSVTCPYGGTVVITFWNGEYKSATTAHLYGTIFNSELVRKSYLSAELTNLTAHTVTYNAVAGETFYFHVCGQWRQAADQPYHFVVNYKLDGAGVFAPDQTYTGEELTPAVTVSLGGRPLTLGVDYEVLSYSNNINAGDASVEIGGLGLYAGSASASFKIAKAGNGVDAEKTSVNKSYKTKALKKRAATIPLPKVTAEFGKAAWKVKAKDKKRILSLKKGKVKVEKGAKKGTYTIKLVAKVAESRNYNAASSKVVTVEVVVK